MSGSSKVMVAVNQFIALANEMTGKENVDRRVVSTALMRACAVYSTYVITGNDGALKKSGVEKITQLFSEELTLIQDAKVKEAEKQGKLPSGGS